MQSTKIRSNPTTGTAVHVVGENYMVLTGRYREDQLWLAFMDRTVYSTSPPPPPPREHRRVRKSENPDYVQIDGSYRELYPTDGNPHQMVLPFREGKRVSNRQLKALAKDNYPTWDKNPAGELYTVSIRSGEKRDDIITWCRDNCRRRFFLRGQETLTFESEIDAINCKLRFS